MRGDEKAAGPAAWMLFTLGLLAFAGSAVVALVVFSRPVEEGRRPSEPAPDLRPVLTEIAELRAVMSQLRLALGASPPTTSPAPLAPAPMDAASLQPLVEALDRLSAQLGARLPGIDAPEPRAEAREELRALLWPEGELTDEESEAWATEQEQRKLHYLFWTEQHVLDSFGRPDSASARENGTWTWTYLLDSDRDVTLLFTGGRVIDVWPD